ncbi:MAG: hypothetical protein HN494_00345, partial [Opitutae bacterium]|nr:hypothetical protein [Opitutae bacterium]
MKKTHLIILGFIFLLNLVGCSDNPASSPSSAPGDANATGSTNTEVNGTASQTWFGPPLESALILALRQGEMNTGALAKLTAWVVKGFEGNLAIPSPSLISVFSSAEPVYVFLKNNQTYVLGSAANPDDENISISGFTVVTTGDRRIAVPGESPESTANAQSILAGQTVSASHQRLSSFMENFSSAGLYLSQSSLVVDLGSTPGALSASVRHLNSEAEPFAPSGNLQWGLIPRKSAAAFGATGLDNLLQPFANFLMGHLRTEAKGQSNATASWVLQFARLLDSAGTARQTFPSPSGGHLFALAPPSDTNATLAPFAVPAKLKSADSALHVDFIKLGPLLTSGSSSLLDQPAFSL